MIYVTGDTHGEYGRIAEFDRILKPNDYIIICGDWGYLFLNNEKENKILNEIEQKKWTMLFIDGNHENFPAINACHSELYFHINNERSERMKNKIILNLPLGYQKIKKQKPLIYGRLKKF